MITTLSLNRYFAQTPQTEQALTEQALEMSSGSPQAADDPSGPPALNEQASAYPNTPCQKSTLPPSRLTKSRHWNAGLSGPPFRPSLQGMPGAESTTSSTPDSPFDQLSPLAIDRVYPMRSVVSVDPTPTPSIRSEDYGGEGFPGMVLPKNSAGANIMERRTERRQHSSSSAQSIDNSKYGMETSSNATKATATTASAAAREAGAQTCNASQKMKRRSSYAFDAGERMGGSRQIHTYVDTSSKRSESVSGDEEDTAPSTTA